MSLISNAMSNAYYTALSHNSGITCGIAQMSLLRNAGAMDSRLLANADKNLSLQRIKDNLTQKIADAMLENNKKEKLRGFDTFA